jgi:hypothetical protein
MPDLWRVMLHAEEPDLTCEAWLSEDVPTPTGGGGGHETITLPKRRPVVVWKQAGLWTMTLGLVFDRFSVGESVAGEYADLLRMWRPRDESDEPPTLRIDAPGDAVPLQHLSWVITDLTWGPAEANSAGNRARQQFNLTLTEWNPDERLEFSPAATPSKARRAKRKSKSKASTRRAPYVVHSGDTLSEIAQKLHIKGGWRALAEAQHPPITDPRSLRVGQHLRMP